MPNYIQKAPHRDNYCIIDRRTLQNKNISWAATGMLAYLLSLPSNWKLTKEELIGHKTNKRDGTRAVFEELLKNKYIYKRERKDTNLKNQFNYYVFEKPYTEKEIKEMFTLTDIPLTENPITENPSQQSKHTLSKDKVNKVDISVQNTKKCFKPPTGFYFCLELNEFTGITSLDKARWKEAYPSIDLRKELIKAEEWCRANNSKAKLKKNWRKFVTNWLSKADEKSFNRAAYQSTYAPQRKSAVKDFDNNFSEDDAEIARQREALAKQKDTK